MKKHRQDSGLFIAEGEKLINSFSEANWTAEVLVYNADLEGFNTSAKAKELAETQPKTMQILSNLVMPPGVLAVYKIPKAGSLDLSKNCLILDGISDPGNLGTIIRQAAWFGIKQIVCTNNCADAYSPKVVQATMGALAEVSMISLEIDELMSELKAQNSEVFVADMAGLAPMEIRSVAPAALVIGSESHGPSEVWDRANAKKISIPKAEGSLTDSLNAAVATGILLYEWAGVSSKN